MDEFEKMSDAELKALAKSATSAYDSEYIDNLLNEVIRRLILKEKI